MVPMRDMFTFLWLMSLTSSVRYIGASRIVLDWFRMVYFSYHARVRVRFKLAAVLGKTWTRDGSIPQGCPLSIVSIVVR